MSVNSLGVKVYFSRINMVVERFVGEGTSGKFHRMLYCDLETLSQIDERI